MDEITLLALLLTLGGPAVEAPATYASVTPAAITRACEVTFEQPSAPPPAETKKES